MHTERCRAQDCHAARELALSARKLPEAAGQATET